MAGDGSVVVVGGTRAIGPGDRAGTTRATGRDVVLTGQSPENVDARGGRGDGGGRPGPRPHVRPRAAPQDRRLPCGRRARERLALAAIDRDHNSVADYHIDRAIRLVTLKLVGYTAVVSALRDRLSPTLVGRAVRRHGEGAAVPGLDHGHDRQRWRRRADPDAGRGAQAHPRQLDPPRRRRRQPLLGGEAGRDRAATPPRRRSAASARMDEIVDAVVFLLENTAVNGVDLIVDGGWHTR